MITWFGKNKQQNKISLIIFDIINFYRSIKPHHLLKAIRFARKYTCIEVKDIKVIKHICKTTSTLKLITKKDENTLYDVSMGSFFCADLCEFERLYVLHSLQSIYNANEIVSLRDNGLANIAQKRNYFLENAKKKISYTIYLNWL